MASTTSDCYSDCQSTNPHLVLNQFSRLFKSNSCNEDDHYMSQFQNPEEERGLTINAYGEESKGPQGLLPYN